MSEQQRWYGNSRNKPHTVWNISVSCFLNFFLVKNHVRKLSQFLSSFRHIRNTTSRTSLRNSFSLYRSCNQWHQPKTFLERYFQLARWASMLQPRWRMQPNKWHLMKIKTSVWWDAQACFSFSEIRRYLWRFGARQWHLLTQLKMLCVSVISQLLSV